MPSEGAQPNIQFRVQNHPSLPTPASAFNSGAVTARSEPRYRPSLAAGLRLSCVHGNAAYRRCVSSPSFFAATPAPAFNSPAVTARLQCRTIDSVRAGTADPPTRPSDACRLLPQIATTSRRCLHRNADHVCSESVAHTSSGSAWWAGSTSCRGRPERSVPVRRDASRPQHW